ncbi:MAG: hypothetical protein ACREVK_06430 [Gammaproteobacteria bacterium]
MILRRDGLEDTGGCLHWLRADACFTVQAERERRTLALELGPGNQQHGQDDGEHQRLHVVEAFEQRGDDTEC